MKNYQRIFKQNFLHSELMMQYGIVQTIEKYAHRKVNTLSVDGTTWYYADYWNLLVNPLRFVSAIYTRAWRGLLLGSVLLDQQLCWIFCTRSALPCWQWFLESTVCIIYFIEGVVFPVRPKIESIIRVLTWLIFLILVIFFRLF